MIAPGLVSAAQALLVSVHRGALPAGQVDAVSIGACALLMAPGAAARPLRDHGARIASALLSLEHATPTLASARCWRILREAQEAELLDWALSLHIPPVPAHALRIATQVMQ